MKKNKDRNREYHSMLEVEKKFFPKHFEEKINPKPNSPIELGKCLAEESTNILKERMKKIV